MVSVTAPPRPEKLASRRSPCPLCIDSIEMGDPIRQVSDLIGWAHTHCDDRYQSALEDRFEGDELDPTRDRTAIEQRDCALCGTVIPAGAAMRQLSTPRIWVHPACAEDYEAAA